MASKAVAVLAAVLLAAAAAMGGGAGVASAQPCNNIGELAAVCKPAFVGGSPPTTACCAKLRSHETCFCQYQSNPAYGSYINNPNTIKTLTKCRITIPNC